MSNEELDRAFRTTIQMLRNAEVDKARTDLLVFMASSLADAKRQEGERRNEFLRKRLDRFDQLRNV